MKLGIFLAVGESWEEFEANGQDVLLLRNNFSEYLKKYSHILVFSYGKGSKKIHPQIDILGNNWKLHRYIYALLMPFLYHSEIRSLSMSRGMQLTGGIPALTAKLFSKNRVIINYGYDYSAVAKIEHKYIQFFGYLLIEKIILALVDNIIITNSVFRNKFNFIPSKKIVLIPNGIDTNVFKPSHSRKTISVLFVGRLETQKNLLVLLEALSLLSQIKLKVVFIGRGAQLQVLNRVAKDLKIPLKIIPQVPNHKLVSYYSRAKVFVLPSLREGNPKALLEAMSCELAVVGTNVEGIREVIHHGKNGLLIKNNPKDLANAIRALLESSKLRRIIGKEARKTILKRYNRVHTWNKELQLFKKLSN